MENGSDHHFGLAVDLAIEALKSVILLNGGAAAALIALTGKDGGAPNYSTAILAFGIGVWLAVIAFACGYFSQLAYANHTHSFEQDMKRQSSKEWRRHIRFQKVTIALVGSSPFCGTYGMFEAWRSANAVSQTARCNCANSAIQPVQGK